MSVIDINNSETKTLKMDNTAEIENENNSNDATVPSDLLDDTAAPQAWIDLSGHEDDVQSNPTETVQETDKSSDENEDKVHPLNSFDEGESDKSENCGSDRDDDDDDTDGVEEDGNGNGDNDESESESESDFENNNEMVCVVYDTKYQREHDDEKYMFIGTVVDQGHDFMAVDFGEEGVLTFEKSPSEFSRHTYTDKSNWTVRIHKIDYDYDSLTIVDKTREEYENSMFIPPQLQVPTILAFGYIFIISLITPLFTSVCKSIPENEYVGQYTPYEHEL